MSIRELLFGKSKRKELPTYSSLEKTPDRGLPTDLAALEGGDPFAARHDVLRGELLALPRRPPEDEPLLTSFAMREQGRAGLLTFPLPDGRRCVPVFSTPVRAADYRQTLLENAPMTSYLASSPAQFIQMLRDIERVGLDTFALDRCPRCSTFGVFGGPSMRTPDDVITAWAISKATEQARLEAYLAFAIRSALAGDMEVARDIALQVVGHVTPENPFTHLLLGQVAVALGDGTLLREARAFLSFLRKDAMLHKLQQAQQAGTPDFASIRFEAGA
jgi:hypothetical protein